MDFVTDTAKLLTELLDGFAVSTCGSKIDHRVGHVINRRQKVGSTEQFLGGSRNPVVIR